MGLDALSALYWDFWQIPYYKVYELKGNKVVKIFNQRVVNSSKGSNVALIDYSNKLGWWITDTYIVHKSQIIFMCDISNALPLQIEESKEITGNLILKEKTKRMIKVNKKKLTTENSKANGKPSKFVEIHFPSNLLFQLIDAHFVKETLSSPPSKWDELKWVFIVAIIAGAFLLWQLISNGGFK